MESLDPMFDEKEITGLLFQFYQDPDDTLGTYEFKKDDSRDFKVTYEWISPQKCLPAIKATQKDTTPGCACVLQ